MTYMNMINKELLLNYAEKCMPIFSPVYEVSLNTYRMDGSDMRQPQMLSHSWVTHI